MRYKTIRKLKEYLDNYFYDGQLSKKDVQDFLVDKLYELSDLYDKDCHYENVISELIERDYDTIKMPNSLLDRIVDTYEEKLGDFGSENGWRYILDSVIEEYEDDLVEYKE